MEQLDRIEEKLDLLIIWKAGMEERCISHRAQTSEHHKTLFANPGLVTRVERLWNCKKDSKTWHDFIKGIASTVIAIGIISILAWLLWLYQYTPVQ